MCINNTGPSSWLGDEKGFILIEFGNGVRIQGFITIATENNVKIKCQTHSMLP
jgi:hypothetical protein